MSSQKKPDRPVEGTGPQIEDGPRKVSKRRNEHRNRRRHSPHIDGHPEGESHTQLLLLPDGRLFVHNLTPAMAQLLQKLDPGDRFLQQRTLPAPAALSSATHS
jgi:hypothetical protein